MQEDLKKVSSDNTVVWIRELKVWDTVVCDVQTNWIDYKDKILTYNWMDWAYAKLVDSDSIDLKIYNASWYVHKVWEHYMFADKLLSEK